MPAESTEPPIYTGRMAPDLTAMSPQDWAAVREIYRQGIATGNATFETSVPGWEQWDAGHLPCCRLLARDGEDVLGWAALSRVSSRAVYAGVAEVSVYVAAQARGHGVGSMLLSALVTASEQNGIWTLQASVFPENQSSIALHRRCGFREVGTRQRIGCREGRWRDTVLMERRSAAVGI